MNELSFAIISMWCFEMVEAFDFAAFMHEEFGDEID